MIPIVSDFLKYIRYKQEMSDPPMLSSAAKDVLKKVRMVVPPLLDKFHKGKLYVGSCRT